MMSGLEPILIVTAVVVSAFLFWKPLRSFGREVHTERARESFKLQRERLESVFLKAAQTSGKPRGLMWKSIEWDEEVCFAREKSTKQIAALIGATIQFEAIPGSDMEGLPAVGNLRNASAVFFFHRGHWHTVGKAVFNMNPQEAIQHFSSLYELVENP